MRRVQARSVLKGAFKAGSDRFGFRLVEYSIQSNHLHLLVEAKDREALSRGMKGLLVRVAKGLNRLWQRKGSVFSDRYHDRILRTPQEVRSALVYVLNNARRHGVRLKTALDAFSSGPWFEGWSRPVPRRERPEAGSPLARARTWLLRVGWEIHGRLRWGEKPAGAPG